MAAVACHNLSRRYGSLAALEHVSCEAASGSVLLVTGPSGAGKTTLLRLIAGLEAPSSGCVTIGGEVVSGPGVLAPPHERGVAFVFQRPTLWPHMNARQNVALALAGKRLPRRERHARAEQALRRLGMAGRVGAWPATLSGGEMQRVSLARALVTEPRILLLDEPFEGLDPDLRKEMTDRLAGLKSDRGVTIIWVTHRRDEALAIADSMLTLRDGRVEHNAP